MRNVRIREGEVKTWLRNRFTRSELFSFNLVRRDRWIAEQAAIVPSGTKVLDVGAGSCPYRNLFAHCEYRSQDLAPLRGDQLRHGAYLQSLYGVPINDLAEMACRDRFKYSQQILSCAKWALTASQPQYRVVLARAYRPSDWT